MNKKNCAAILFAAISMLLAGCSTTHSKYTVLRWEYKKVNSIEAANKAAVDGWVLANYAAYVETARGNTSLPETTYNMHHEIYILKRPKH